MLIYFCLAAAGILLAVIFSRFGFGIPCVFRELTGFRCGGCGNTHAVTALLRLRPVEALRANYFFPAELLYACSVVVQFTATYVKSGRKELLPKPEIINVIFLALLIIWSVFRNIVGI